MNPSEDERCQRCLDLIGKEEYTENYDGYATWYNHKKCESVKQNLREVKE